MRPRTHSTTLSGHTGNHTRAAKATYVADAVTQQPPLLAFLEPL
jgi:hypothetical protein